jgi:hypothetical protein
MEAPRGQDRHGRAARASLEGFAFVGEPWRLDGGALIPPDDIPGVVGVLAGECNSLELPASAQNFAGVCLPERTSYF